MNTNSRKLTWSLIAILGLISGCDSVPPSINEPIETTAETLPTMAEGTMNHQQHMNHGDMDHGHLDLGPADENYDLRFIDAMIPHHEGAIIMAQEVLAKSDRPELQNLAAEIIQAQASEIAQMREWRQGWYPDAPDTPMAWNNQMNHMMEMSPQQISAMRMDMDLGQADDEFDRRFLKAMIPHHEGALVMAKDLQEKSDRPEMQSLAEDILTSQEAEIAQMEAWLKEW
ncbi:MAG: DUF305 domain-containing protein [Arthrospira sp. SH-MAG29]|nr:DUF305 domain-containing protein [Arthrospira sp. SH-MAG29]MBS0018485.1 DUF305 domain-containing protein [Arthrospira sp. SH-MAG29]